MTLSYGAVIRRGGRDVPEVGRTVFPSLLEGVEQVALGISGVGGEKREAASASPWG